MTPREGKPWPPLPLMQDEQVIESGVDRDFLTQRYTSAAIEFMEQHQDRPFFLYLPHAMPGSTQRPFAHPDFQGRSRNGPYGDSIEELDWSMGEILSALERLNLDERTLVVWMSDNGAPRRNPPQGSNAPLKGWGYDTSEGAMRVPGIVRWPGRVPSGVVSDELCTSMDLLPTFAHLAGARLPKDRIIDGRNIWPILSGHPAAVSPHPAFFYYFRGQLQAVRSGPWKLLLPLGERSLNRRTSAPQKPVLIDLNQDLGETNNVAARHPEIVAQLLAHAHRAQIDLGDIEMPGQNQRPAGWVEQPTPRLPD